MDGLNSKEELVSSVAVSVLARVGITPVLLCLRRRIWTLSAKWDECKILTLLGNFMTHVFNKEQELAVCIIAFNFFLIVPQPSESVYTDVSWLAALKVASCDQDMVMHRFSSIFVSCC